MNYYTNIREIKLLLKGIFFFLFIICSLHPGQVAGETITLVADEWPPFNSTPGSPKEGFLIDVAKAVFKNHGIEVSYQLLPWKRAIELSRTGDFNGIIGASKTDAPDFIFPAEALACNTLAFYTRKGATWKFKVRSDIEKVSLGVIAGYDYRKWLIDYIEKNKDDFQKVQIMTGDQPLSRNIMKLLDSRIDAIVGSDEVIRAVAGKMGVTDRLSLAGYGFETSDIYIAFSPNHPDSKRYAEMLSIGIIDLRKRGRLKAILSKYGLQDWKQ